MIHLPISVSRSHYGILIMSQYINMAQSAIDRHKAKQQNAASEQFFLKQCALEQLQLNIETKRQSIADYLAMGASVVRSQVLAALEKDLLDDERRYLSLNDELIQIQNAVHGTTGRDPRSESDFIEASKKITPPHSNTGGIGEAMSWGDDYLLVQHGNDFVRVPRPNLSKSTKCAFIDWLTFTFKVDDFYKAFPESRAISNDGLDIVCDISAKLNHALGFGVTSKRDTGKYFYKHSYVIGDNWGLLCIGGQADTVCISITGQGFLAVKRGWQKRLISLGETLKAKITRADLAADFFNGEYTVEKADSDDSAGLFSLGARSPKIQHLGNWKRPDGSGRTLMVGSRDSGKLLRIYEKGLQLGGIFSDIYKDWTRVELELHNRDRVIPWSVLLDAGQYLAGAYPALSFISKEQTKIKTKKNIVKATVERAKQTIKHQFGRYLWAFNEILGVDGLKDLFVEEFPKRLIVPDWHNSPPLISMPVLAL